MKTHTKLFFGGIIMLAGPVIILAGCIAYQLAHMDPPSAAHLNLRWGFLVFYAMAAGLVMLIFARGLKQEYRKKMRQ
ncbi:MAG: hypothetical protein PHH77_07970 [Victivallaceae bacterium]|nr:hypothetical protein [Victivallaceae bacterium]